MSVQSTCLQVVAMAKPALSSAEKMLLIRVLHLYGSEVVSRPIKQLAQQLGLSDGVIQKARDALVSKKILVELDGVPRAPLPGKRSRGRPPKAFSVSESFLAWLNSWSHEAGKREGGNLLKEGVGSVRRYKERSQYGLVQERDRQVLVRLMSSSHQVNMSALLFPGVPSEQEEKPSRPVRKVAGEGGTTEVQAHHYTHKLLLAVLLGFADKGGVVRGIGLGMLARLVGLERDSIAYPLGVLAQEGYLRSHVPGVTGQMAFGLASGAFFLNIGHVGLVQPTPELLVFCRDGIMGEDHPFRVSWQLYESVASLQFKIQKQASMPGEKKSALSPFHDLMWRGSASSEAQSETLEQVKAWLLSNREGELEAQYISADEFLPIEFMGGDGAWARHWLDRLWKDYQLYWLFETSKSTAPRYLQLKVEEYASDLLSNFWPELGEGGLYPEELMKRIQQEMLPPSVQVRLKGISTLPPRLVEAFGCFVYVRAWCMAYWIKVLLKVGLPMPYRGQNLSKYRITVLPISRLSALGVTVSLVGKHAPMPSSFQMEHVERKGERIERDIISYDAHINNVNAAKGIYWLSPPGIKSGLRKTSKKMEGKSFGAEPVL